MCDPACYATGRLSAHETRSIRRRGRSRLGRRRLWRSRFAITFGGSAGSDRHRNRVARNRRAFDARYRTPVVVASCLLFPANLAFDACGGLFPAHSSPDGVAVKGNIAFVAENGSAFVQNPTATSFGSICVPVGRTSSGALRSSTTRSASRSVRTETSTSLRERQDRAVRAVTRSDSTRCPNGSSADSARTPPIVSCA